MKNNQKQENNSTPYGIINTMSWKQFYKMAYGIKHFKYGADYRNIIQAKWDKRRIERLYKKINENLSEKTKEKRIKI